MGEQLTASSVVLAQHIRRTLHAIITNARSFIGCMAIEVPDVLKHKDRLINSTKIEQAQIQEGVHKGLAFTSYLGPVSVDKNELILVS